MNLELTGMNGERAALTEAKIYSNALVLCIDSIEDGITPFYENNVVLLKRKDWDEPSTYLGPVSAKADGDNLQTIYRIDRENIGNIEALACGQGGERELCDHSGNICDGVAENRIDSLKENANAGYF